jgi:hypothetical protein
LGGSCTVIIGETPFWISPVELFTICKLETGPLGKIFATTVKLAVVGWA